MLQDLTTAIITAKDDGLHEQTELCVQSEFIQIVSTFKGETWLVVSYENSDLMGHLEALFPAHPHLFWYILKYIY